MPLGIINMVRGNNKVISNHRIFRESNEDEQIISESMENKENLDDHEVCKSPKLPEKKIVCLTNSFKCN